MKWTYLVLLSLANHNDAVHGDSAEHATHGIDSSLQGSSRMFDRLSGSDEAAGSSRDAQRLAPVGKARLLSQGAGRYSKRPCEAYVKFGTEGWLHAYSRRRLMGEAW